jgi:hypothetical protein
MSPRPRPPGHNDADLALRPAERKQAVERQHVRNARIALRAADTTLRTLSVLLLTLHVPAAVRGPIEEIACHVETALEALEELR